MNGIFTYMWLIFMGNVGKYTIITWILWELHLITGRGPPYWTVVDSCFLGVPFFEFRDPLSPMSDSMTSVHAAASGTVGQWDTGQVYG